LGLELFSVVVEVIIVRPSKFLDRDRNVSKVVLRETKRDEPDGDVGKGQVKLERRFNEKSSYHAILPHP
jgi:hypothetical protein